MNSPTAKPFWKSKTLLVQALALAAMFSPPVARWVAANPVEFVAALGAINTLVRFATSGRVTIFPDDDDTSGNGSAVAMGVGAAAGQGRGASTHVQTDGRTRHCSWLVGAACVSALALSSCVVGVSEGGDYSLRTDPRLLDRVFEELIRHEPDSAKSGLK
jgi:hypothetical protein